jgi:two-component system, cell cycle sensor histidine kinase and response regulator CckA
VESENASLVNDEQYRLIAQNIRDLVSLLDLDGRFLYASPSFERVLGRSPKDLIGRDPCDLMHPEDLPAWKALCESARLQREPRKADLRFLHQDGQALFFESVLAFHFDAQGAPHHAVVVSRDISERKQTEDEIGRLAAFPRHNPNPVLAFTADGTLTYYNQAAQLMVSALHRKHIQDILPLNFAAVVRLCIASGQRDLRLENTIAGRTLSWSFYPVHDSQIVHCYAEDMTERLELETRLRQSQKMESVGQLAAGLAHDFNNILTIIQGHSGLLLNSQQANSALGESLRQIAQAAERAGNLTRQLLMFSRKQLAQPQLMNLNEAIKESARMVRVLVGEAVQLDFQYAPNLPTIYADPGMIHQVLINLAANARDAMPKGGLLTVRTFPVELTENDMERIPEVRPGPFVVLSVADDGCGMSAATRERLFEPFFTTKEPGRGTGLGLATVYGIVKQHQGWVDVESEVGRGTTFRIHFPAVAKAPEQGAEAGETHIKGGSETIFVVEDESALRELVLEILQQYGYRTIEAANGLQALQVWREHKNKIDLLLTDVVMPNGVSGRELAEQILADNPRVKVIYTSGYPIDVLGRDFTPKEGLVFLQKPYKPTTLARTVRECLDSNTSEPLQPVE